MPEAIAEGGFFQMQTMTAALIELVVKGAVDEETAATAAPNRHDFSIALRRAIQEHALTEDGTDDANDEEEADPVAPAASSAGALSADGLRLL